MKLRTKLGLTVLLGLLPIAASLLWMQQRLHRSAFEEGVVDAVLSRMGQGGRARCEEDPAGFGRGLARPMHRPGARFGPGRGGPGPGRPGPGRPSRGPGMGRAVEPGPDGIFAYSADLRPSDVDVPPLDEGLASRLRAGERFAVRPAPGHRGMLLYAVRMPWSEGPCAVLALRRPVPPRPHFPLPLLALSALAAALAVLAGGPVVRRIRRLTRAIRETPEGQPAELELRGTDEVAELARAFDAKQRQLAQQMEALRRRDRALSQHLANTMHDVMIPLTVLEGYLMRLRTDMPAADADAATAPVLASAIEETHYIATLLTNLDAWARLDADEASLGKSPVDLKALVERVVARHRPVARERLVSLEYAVPDEAVTWPGDETLLERAVGNLVHNAVRHNRREGHVAVVLETREDGFELRVLDDGPGLTPEQVERVLGRGVVGENSRSRSGHGLGLSITARAARLHGLTLEFRHPEQGGLEVVLRPEGASSDEVDEA